MGGNICFLFCLDDESPTSGHVNLPPTSRAAVSVVSFSPSFLSGRRRSFSLQIFTNAPPADVRSWTFLLSVSVAMPLLCVFIWIFDTLCNEVIIKDNWIFFKRCLHCLSVTFVQTLTGETVCERTVFLYMEAFKGQKEKLNQRVNCSLKLQICELHRAGEHSVAFSSYGDHQELIATKNS